jgi:hypothetical protein
MVVADQLKDAAGVTAFTSAQHEVAGPQEALIGKRNYDFAADDSSRGLAPADFAKFSFADYQIFQSQPASNDSMRALFSAFQIFQNFDPTPQSSGSDSAGSGGGTRGFGSRLPIAVLPESEPSADAAGDNAEALLTRNAIPEAASQAPSSQILAASTPAPEAVTNQSAGPADRAIVHSARLAEEGHLPSLAPLARIGPGAAPKVGESSDDGGADQFIAAARTRVQSAVASLSGVDGIADLVHTAPSLADIPLNLQNVQRALDTVLCDIAVLGGEFRQWLDSVPFTPMVAVVTAATAGAGAAIYVRRRRDEQPGQGDGEASSTWLFARLQAIPLA